MALTTYQTELFMQQLAQTARKSGNHDRQFVFQPETQLAKVEKQIFDNVYCFFEPFEPFVA